MPDMPHLWMRHESRASERRAPLVPEDAARLVAQGATITVEESPQRAFPLTDYTAAGCRTAPAGSWADAPDDVFVVGLKELPDEPKELRHRHVFFGHAYKGQTGARELLDRFTSGGGRLLDLEYLTDGAGRRLAAFGYWAGYVGAALAVLHRRGTLTAPLRPLDKARLDALLAAGSGGSTGSSPRGTRTADALVIGALGRSGRGACDALEVAGVETARWDVAETRELDRAALIDHDILVNTVLVTRPVPPFLRTEDLDDPRCRISVVADVTCDVTSECNVLPVYDEITDWERPARALRGGERPVDVIAIDNLPSLLPVEASRAFSAELAPHLGRLGTGDPVWERCLGSFEAAVRDDGGAREAGPSPHRPGDRAAAPSTTEETRP
ncbi:saccharopine dehydrogenase [Streptomyces sp. WAC05374]|uniref:saccharopine dehydrogenase n=1 Tax=Streptomyces sp. WAC05374 TaxID=2487420 RepID=UPI000F8853E8|nr:saccharopine dehydrogenase [Streptomyces sp. WAC05374]RST19066.1 saccharopine dehydrogenase [Streptomyces sp. WAC05374]TDF36966.1 saccharopine dehydrogenase [Streptomyces sp. WAC05374]TDF46461.1 saccharopine dehydrogenase [Streptomyces sp. WAC05374]TDF47562.1 saccharopine dehydrogenase [Streptomyces sp. WAC05374]